MTTKTIARCSIYESRPDVCRAYPTVSHYTPPECTYYFTAEGERHGDCACDVGACCAIPRENGEPGGAPIPKIAGGEPCKYLEWRDVDVPEEATVKTASRLPIFNDLMRKASGGATD